MIEHKSNLLSKPLKLFLLKLIVKLTLFFSGINSASVAEESSSSTAGKSIKNMFMNMQQAQVKLRI